jgi:flagellar biosynthetic protein FliR
VHAFNLFGLTQAQFETYLLVGIRIMAMLSLMPIFSGNQVPVLLRLGLAVIMTFAIGSIVVPLGDTLALGPLAAAVLAQMVIGIVFGFVASLVFTGIQFAGQIIDTQIGFAIANIINPTTQQQVTIIGELELALGTLLYLVSNAHYYLLQGLAGSFALLPLPFVDPHIVVATDVIRFFTEALFLVFRIGAPVAVTLVVVNIALAFMARVAPQMNVFVIGFPLQIAVGLVMLIVSLPLMGFVLPQVFAEQPAQFDAVFRGLAASPLPAPAPSPAKTP